MEDCKWSEFLPFLCLLYKENIMKHQVTIFTSFSYHCDVRKGVGYNYSLSKGGATINFLAKGPKNNFHLAFAK